MFTKPKHGWTDVFIEDFEGAGSYIWGSLPEDCVHAFIQYLKNNESVELFFDEEGSDFTLFVENEKVRIVANNYEGFTEEYNFDITGIELAKELAEDIEMYFEEWVTWPPDYGFFEEDEQEEQQKFYDARYKELKELLDELKSLI